MAVTSFMVALDVGSTPTAITKTVNINYKMAELTGKVIAVLPLASGVSNRTGNEWASQEYVIEEVGVQYPQRLCFRIFGRDKIQQYAIFPDEIIKVHFSFSCREHNGKWYNEINCWNVERPQAEQPIPQTHPVQQQFSPTQQPIPQTQNNAMAGQWQNTAPHPQEYAQQTQGDLPF